MKSSYLSIIVLSSLLILICQGCTKDIKEPIAKKIFPCKKNHYKAVGFDEESYIMQEYDKNGNIIKDATYNKDKILIGYLTYEYDLSGKLLREASYSSFGLSSYGLYRYNTQNQCVRVDFYLYDNTPSGYVTREYNNEGKLVKQSEYAKNQLIAYNMYEYNSKGLETKFIQYNMNNKVEWYYTKTYDNQGNVILFESYQGIDDPNKSTYKYEYNQFGKLIKTTFYSSNAIKYYTIYHYNNDNELIKEELFGLDNILYSFITYDYTCTL